ncbi:AAA family ATPase [Streptomyces sp. TLI_185]|uniref:AAA family ATPase n=1 Tax=Streptomyces sp. TLI_185 TaxID=2485151 RepID=UPI000F4EF5FD|nr:AAA family ATPase [Streptomyces sp. TLI_185]RPF33429.1 AAA domain-containing protein [Streptomyces sp. TLI_185]
MSNYNSADDRQADRLIAYVDKVVAEESAKVRNCPDNHTGNDTLNTATFSLATLAAALAQLDPGLLPADKVRETMTDAISAWTFKNHDEADQHRTIDSAIRDGWARPRNLDELISKVAPDSDETDADRFMNGRYIAVAPVGVPQQRQAPDGATDSHSSRDGAAEAEGAVCASGLELTTFLSSRDGAAEAEGAVCASGLELTTFLAEVPEEPDWLVAGLLERQDRLILTGPEGKGKSTLLRQIAVQLASGLHPFGGAELAAPLRVLLVDLENSPRQIHRKIRPLHLAAGDKYAGGLVLVVRGEGLDLTDGGGEILEAEVAAAQPDVLIIGPLYKMEPDGDDHKDSAKIAQRWLDKIRTRYDCAVILEAHTPHASNGGARPTRPYGSSLWLRWPEFGVHLADNGTLSHWRGQRDERSWPPMLQRGGEWPWTPVTRPRDLLWARIAALCAEAGEQLSERDLAQLTGESKTAVHRAIDEHRSEWDALSGGASE